MATDRQRHGRRLLAAFGVVLVIAGLPPTVGGGIAAWSIWGPHLALRPAGGTGSITSTSMVGFGGRMWSADQWQAKAVVAIPIAVGVLLIAAGALLVLRRSQERS